MQRGQPNAFEGLDMSGWLSATTPPGFSPGNGLDIDFDAWESAQRSAAKADFSSLAMPAPLTPQQQAQPKLQPQMQQQMQPPPQQQIPEVPLITLPQQSSAQASNAKRSAASRATKAAEPAAPKRSKRGATTQQQKQQQQPQQESQHQDKRYLNKLAADKYRRKKRQQFEELSAKSQSMEHENHRLKTQCSTLENQVDFLKQALLSAVQSSAKQAPQPTAKHSPPSSPFDMEEFAKAYMKKHAQEATARIHQLEQKVAALSTQLQTQTP